MGRGGGGGDIWAPMLARLRGYYAAQQPVVTRHTVFGGAYHYVHAHVQELYVMRVPAIEVDLQEMALRFNRCV